MILHLVPMMDWMMAVEEGAYRPESLATEGFIHCSKPHQIAAVANALYAGRRGMVMLIIDESLVSADIVWEDCYATGQDFPHIYGALDPAAVVGVVPYEPGDDGLFATPQI